MNPVSGISEILRAERGIAENFASQPDAIPKKITDAWVLMIHITDAIDSGDYLRAVNFHPVQSGGDLLEYLVDTSDNPKVDYPGFVEGGTKFMAGRYPAQKSIEREDFVPLIRQMVETPLGKGAK